jgi:hypothetical protein
MSDADGVDISKLSPEEQQHYKKYGKLKKNVGVKKVHVLLAPRIYVALRNSHVLALRASAA